MYVCTSTYVCMYVCRYACIDVCVCVCVREKERVCVSVYVKYGLVQTTLYGDVLLHP
jgi:hypothetical protein